MLRVPDSAPDYLVALLLAVLAAAVFVELNFRAAARQDYPALEPIQLNPAQGPMVTFPDGTEVSLDTVRVE